MDVFSRIVNQGEAPKRSDIAELLASVGEPGEKREEKEALVRKLYNESGYRAHNLQGHHIVEILDSFGEW